MTDPLAHYSRQQLDDEDKAAVMKVLEGDYLTTGPWVARFEEKLREYVGARHAIAVSSGTAALHLALLAHGVEGRRLPTSALTFVATANAILHAGAHPDFHDVSDESWAIRPLMSAVPVFFGGAAEVRDPLQNGSAVVVDACHALGAVDTYDRMVGSYGTAAFSFHPVKAMTTAEGGAVVTDRDDVAAAVRELRDHGRRDGQMVRLGFNYRLTDIQAALGISQLKKLPAFLAQRRALALEYTRLLRDVQLRRPGWDVGRCAWHLFPVLLPKGTDRAELIRFLGTAGNPFHRPVTLGVHYSPIVPLQPYYRERFGSKPGDFPVAEDIAARTVSLPLHQGMELFHVRHVVDALTAVLEKAKGVTA